MSKDQEDQLPPRTPEQIAIHIAIRVGALVLFVYLCLLIVRPFSSILVWSVILTVSTHPVFLWINARLGGRGKLAAFFLTLVLIILVIGPIATLGSSLVMSLERLAESFKGGDFALPALPPEVTGLPMIGEFLDRNWSQVSSNLPAFAKQYMHMFVRPGELFLQAAEGLVGSVSVFALAVLVSGFLHNNATSLQRYGHDLTLRIVGHHGTRFFSLAGVIIQNVAQGIVGIALLEAIAFGCVLLLAGVPHAGLLAVLALVLAISQIGAGLLIAPTVVWLWVTSDWTTALPFTLAMVPIYAMESILKPMLMSRGLGTPTVVIFIGALGGAIAFGLPGLFIGPIVLAVFYELMSLWIEEGRQLEVEVQKATPSKDASKNPTIDP